MKAIVDNEHGSNRRKQSRMLNRIFPEQFDNTYRGHRLAIYLFAVVMLLKGSQGVASIINTRTVLATADGIPLDSFNAAGAEAVVALFAALGLYVLMLPLQGIVVLIRYRAMIPFMFLLFLLVQVSSRVILLVHPIVRSSALPIGSAINLVILAMTLIGFVLSLFHKSDSPGEGSTP